MHRLGQPIHLQPLAFEGLHDFPPFADIVRNCLDDCFQCAPDTVTTELPAPLLDLLDILSHIVKVVFLVVEAAWTTEDRADGDLQAESGGHGVDGRVGALEHAWERLDPLRRDVRVCVLAEDSQVATYTCLVKTAHTGISTYPQS